MSKRLSKNNDNWVLQSSTAEQVKSLAKEVGVSEIVAHCLIARGIPTADAARKFLAPSLEHLFDPNDILNMPAAIARLQKAIREAEQIRVVTDYDVDGTTSSLILQSTLKILGGKEISYHIPDRMKEGYGFSVLAAEKAAKDGINLIVTADIGVKDHDAVRRALSLGVDVLICDHHLPAGSAVPDGAIVLCPPQAGCGYPNKALAACGVSWKLACALLAEHPKRDAILQSMLKLVAIGTVADVVDLANPENRAIVAKGLARLNAGRHTAGLQALLDVSGLQDQQILSSDLGFRVGPRINAAGRLASATTVVELLQSRDPVASRQLANALDTMNQERRKIQEQIIEIALGQVTEEHPPFVLVAGREDDGWHRGVTGIVAGRLRDHFSCPALVITVTDAGCVGSMRSTPHIHAVELLEQAADLLERFGGHPAAAGFSLAASNIADFEQRLSATLGQTEQEQIGLQQFEVDCRVEPNEISMDLVRELAVLEPHGKGNERPLLWIGPVQLRNLKTIKDKHLKGAFQVRGEWIDVIWWSAGHLLEDIAQSAHVEILGRLEINAWRGREKPQIVVETVRLL